MTQKIEISYKSLIFTVFFLLFLWLLFQIKEIIFLLFLSFIAGSGLRPLIERLERFKIPRILAILLVYLFLFALLLLTLSFIIPPLIGQTTKMIKEIAYFFSFLSPYLEIGPEKITEQMAPLGRNIFKVTVSLFSNLVSLFTFFIFTFYLLLERRHMRLFLKNFLGEKLKERIVTVILKIEERLGAWVRGQATLALIIGVFSYIGLRLLQIDFALPLAILAGILEVVPIIGPIISAIPAVIVASVVSPWLSLAVAALYFLIQQLENYIVVPLVMKRAVGIPPMVSILAILIGAKLSGFMGILLSIPLLVCLQVVFKELLSIKGKSLPA